MPSIFHPESLILKGDLKLSRVLRDYPEKVATTSLSRVGLRTQADLCNISETKKKFSCQPTLAPSI